MRQKKDFYSIIFAAAFYSTCTVIVLAALMFVLLDFSQGQVWNFVLPLWLCAFVFWAFSIKKSDG